MADKARIQAEIDEFKERYLKPHDWIKVGQRVVHKEREIYATIRIVGDLNVKLDDLDVREDSKTLLEMQSFYKASIAELSILWEPYDPSNDGTRFERLRGRETVV